MTKKLRGSPSNGECRRGSWYWSLRLTPTSDRKWFSFPLSPRSHEWTLVMPRYFELQLFVLVVNVAALFATMPALLVLSGHNRIGVGVRAGAGRKRFHLPLLPWFSVYADDACCRKTSPNIQEEAIRTRILARTHTPTSSIRFPPRRAQTLPFFHSFHVFLCMLTTPAAKRQARTYEKKRQGQESWLARIHRYRPSDFLFVFLDLCASETQPLCRGLGDRWRIPVQETAEGSADRRSVGRSWIHMLSCVVPWMQRRESFFPGSPEPTSKPTDHSHTQYFGGDKRGAGGVTEYINLGKLEKDTYGMGTDHGEEITKVGG
ncbi:hypothetical protein B0J11DRAFT_161710 [Dendryphion nanum]|uniref:Uncharacterized protein n=1 Tax=Dendryphion nanum TaxID=256645 RepID=A0A9P9IX61_9PLEO|nr:hypothetical protein B0J11DRAFT_161710 [Dendryphion nanum]